jgi:hypothetical protein
MFPPPTTLRFYYNEYNPQAIYQERGVSSMAENNTLYLVVDFVYNGAVGFPRDYSLVCNYFHE